MKPTAAVEQRPLMDSVQTAKFLGGVSPEHVTNLRKYGGLPFVKVGYRVMFRPESVEAWIKEHEQVATS
jgi:hypothetical protein